jgi:hypothetical protein
MRRILTTGALLLALTGAAWSMPSCSDDGPPPVDAGYGTIVDTSAPHPPDAFGVDTSATVDAYFVDTTAALPDAAAPADGGE